MTTHNLFAHFADICGQTDTSVLPVRGSHRADGPADESVLAVAHVASHRADGEVAL